MWQRSVIGPWSTLESGANVEDSGRVRAGEDRSDAIVRRAILDKDVVVGRRCEHRSRPRGRPEPGVHGHRHGYHRGREGHARRLTSTHPLDRLRISMPAFLVVLDVDSTPDRERGDRTPRRARPALAHRVEEITRRAMNGELDFEASLRARVATLEGLPDSVFATVGAQVTVTAGVPELIAGVRRSGWAHRGRLGRVPRGARPDRRAGRSRSLASESARGARRPPHRRGSPVRSWMRLRRRTRSSSGRRMRASPVTDCCGGRRRERSADDGDHRALGRLRREGAGTGSRRRADRRCGISPGAALLGLRG